MTRGVSSKGVTFEALQNRVAAVDGMNKILVEQNTRLTVTLSKTIVALHVLRKHRGTFEDCDRVLCRRAKKTIEEVSNP